MKFVYSEYFTSYEVCLFSHLEINPSSFWAADLFDSLAIVPDLFEAAAPDLASAAFGKSGRLATSAAAFSDSRLLACWSLENSTNCYGFMLSKVPPVMPIDSKAVTYN